jgi:GNAT superfamily N-acetyltransferase
MQNLDTHRCCVVLTFVGTHPEYQGRRAGSILTEWGLARAKSENIPVYLDSTIPASKVYQKLGFVAVDGLSMMIPGRDGGDYIYEEISMLRTWSGKG